MSVLSSERSLPHAEGEERDSGGQRAVRGVQRGPGGGDLQDPPLQLHHQAGGGRQVRELRQGDRQVEWNDRRAAGPEGRPGGGRHHHHLREGAGGGLHHALHEPWCDHSLQEADKEGPKPVLLPVSALVRCLDLHHHGLPGCLPPPLLPLQVRTIVFSLLQLVFAG